MLIHYIQVGRESKPSHPYQGGKIQVRLGRISESGQYNLHHVWAATTQKSAPLAKPSKDLIIDFTEFFLEVFK